MRYTQAYLRSLPDSVLRERQITIGLALDRAIDTHAPATTWRRRYWRILQEWTRRNEARKTREKDPNAKT